MINKQKERKCYTVNVYHDVISLLTFILRGTVEAERLAIPATLLRQTDEDKVLANFIILICIIIYYVKGIY